MIDSIKSKIRQFIRSDLGLHKIFLYYKTGYVHKFPDSGTDLHLTGYQRSGNTFAANIIINIFPQYKFVTHFHSISSIKAAITNEVPTIVLIRDPLESVLSSILKRVDGEGEDVRTAVVYDLDEYYLYYSYVFKHRDKIKIFKFTDLIDDPKNLILLVSEQLNIQAIDDDVISDAIETAYKNLNSDKRENGDRNMPSHYKENKKKKLLKYVNGRENMVKCQMIYKNIIETYT